MYVSIDREVSRQHRDEIMNEVREARLARTARANRKTYVVRDLSWELARYLATEDFSATSNGVSRDHRRTQEQPRLGS